jgi:hypothetical protein
MILIVTFNESYPITGKLLGPMMDSINTINQSVIGRHQVMIWICNLPDLALVFAASAGRTLLSLRTIVYTLLILKAKAGR